MPVISKHSETTSSAASRAEHSALIKAQSYKLGLHKIGIVRPDALSLERKRLEQWLARGFHGEMNWMARDPDQRTDPRRIFPAARSVIVAGVNYFTAHEHQDRDAAGDRPDTGKVSRYAWGDDYHDIVGDKLRRLLAWIKEQWPGAEGKVCVDIQPVMDKAWAVRAGLGWLGKHTNVITKEFGSWIFIGELLLNLELECAGEKVADQCGSCTLCIDACPTSAIVEPYQVNSNLCISHATIESRAPELPPGVAAKLEGWLYGCDICQDVCPWNQMTPATNESRFAPRAGNVNASLSELLELSQEEYAARFRGSAMKRAKLSGLKRNARSLQDEPNPGRY